MPDIVDEAGALVDEWNARCVRHARRALEGEGALICEDCDTEIPARRREAQPSATRCAPCQERLEGRRRAR